MFLVPFISISPTNLITCLLPQFLTNEQIQIQIIFNQFAILKLLHLIPIFDWLSEIQLQMDYCQIVINNRQVPIDSQKTIVYYSKKYRLLCKILSFIRCNERDNKDYCSFPQELLTIIHSYLYKPKLFLCQQIYLKKQLRLIKQNDKFILSSGISLQQIFEMKLTGNQQNNFEKSDNKIVQSQIQEKRGDNLFQVKILKIWQKLAGSENRVTMNQTFKKCQFLQNIFANSQIQQNSYNSESKSENGRLRQQKHKLFHLICQNRNQTLKQFQILKSYRHNKTTNWNQISSIRNLMEKSMILLNIVQKGKASSAQSIDVLLINQSKKGLSFEQQGLTKRIQAMDDNVHTLVKIVLSQMPFIFNQQQARWQLSQKHQFYDNGTQQINTWKGNFKVQNGDRYSFEGLNIERQ